MKSLFFAAFAVFALSAPAMAVETNPVFYDPATGLYFKEKGKAIPVEGVTGSKGDKGDPGQDGRNGVDGQDGVQGIQGIQGVKGDKGDKGDTGPAGPQGEQGIAGTDGKDGAPGKDGADGAPGERGERGEQGVAGVDGKDGKDGVNGQNGQDGRDGRDATGFDRKSYTADLAAASALGGIHLRTGKAGVTSWSAGVGAVKSAGGGTGSAIAFGLHHGLTDNLGVYGKVSHSLRGKATAVFVGVEGQF